MGNRNTKLQILSLSYEEAEKRVSEAELKRLREAFKAMSVNDLMSKKVFMKEVLGDNVPTKLAEEIYSFLSSSSSGLTFKDLLVGLVLLTRGKQAEKTRFLFCVYSNEAGTHVDKAQLEAHILDTDGRTPPELQELFKQRDRANLDQFSKWLLEHQSVTAFSTWLLKEPCVVRLSDDSETLSFYQILAGVTHLDEKDIIELEKRYWQLKSLSQSGRFDLATFRRLVCPPIPDDVVDGFFAAFDENNDDHIDFKEMSCGISACCRGPITERQKFCFKVFDRDRDGQLDRHDVRRMVSAFVLAQSHTSVDDCATLPTTAPSAQSANAGGAAVAVAGASTGAATNSSTVDADLVNRVAGELLQLHGEEWRVSTEEYLMWSLNNSLWEALMRLLYQVCHIVLGLRPQYRQDEQRIVYEWVNRERRRGLRPGDNWFLVHPAWWTAWQQYVSFDSDAPQHHHYPLQLQQPQSQAQPPRRHQKTSSISSLSAGSIGSGSNVSGASAASKAPPQKPGAINNIPLLASSPGRPPSLTNEGGLLRRGSDGGPLRPGEDFQMLPEPVWWALQSWYGGGPSLPRLVTDSASLELYPISVGILKHQQPPPLGAPGSASSAVNRAASVGRFISGVLPTSAAMAAAAAAAAAVVPGGGSSSSSSTSPNSAAAGSGSVGAEASTAAASVAIPRRILCHSACFSRRHTVGQLYTFFSQRMSVAKENFRLWRLLDDGHQLEPLESESVCLEELGMPDSGGCLLFEVRNRDLTWPEELAELAKSRSLVRRRDSMMRGVTGLNNLGNTCFLNSALQCVSNTPTLTAYFQNGLHLYELNRSNPLGMKGHMAERYAELIKDMWNGNASVVAPLKLRMTIARYSRRFSGNQQHDSQEFLSFLLDGLHEDLNRVKEKPYTELKDSDGRPDDEVAAECWDNHLARNQSIIVDLFHGQLRTEVQCKVCSNSSVKFDPFSVLSLPLPLENSLLVEVIVFFLDERQPVRFGVLLNHDDKYSEVRKAVSDRFSVDQRLIVLAAVISSTVLTFPTDEQQIKYLASGSSLFAYLMPPAVPSLITAAPTRQQPVCNGSGGATGAVGNGPSSTVVANQLSRNSSVNSLVAEQSSTEQQQQQQLQSSSSSLTSRGLGFALVYHRKQLRMDFYFLSYHKTRPSLFSLPCVLPLLPGMKNSDVYRCIWLQVKRLVTPKPEFPHSNHATLGDSGVGNSEYPFQVKLINGTGLACALCPWYRFCRGCPVPCDDATFESKSDHLAVDWEHTALHLRYQASLERDFATDPSLQQLQKVVAEPMNLDACFRAFTRVEELNDKDTYFCSKCREHRTASLAMRLWRLPPVLILHLKRFHFVANRWVKSHKVVTCPTRGLRLQPHASPGAPAATDDAQYHLYAVICHSGILGGGHYVSYARNSTGQWYLYNDSSVKAVSEDQVDMTTAYLLFYERDETRLEELLPDVTGRAPAEGLTQEDEVDTEMRKMCSLQ